MLDPYLAKSQNSDDLEWAISMAASIANELAKTASNRLAFGIAGRESQVLFSHRVADFRRAVLESLAMVEGLESPALAKTLTMLLADGNPNWPILIVSPRSPRTDLLTVHDPQSDFRTIQPALMSRLDITWLDVTSQYAQRIAQRPVGRRPIAQGASINGKD